MKATWKKTYMFPGTYTGIESQYGFRDTSLFIKTPFTINVEPPTFTEATLQAFNRLFERNNQLTYSIEEGTGEQLLELHPLINFNYTDKAGMLDSYDNLTDDEKMAKYTLRRLQKHHSKKTLCQ